MNDHHPLALRPGGPSPSGTPDPQQQQMRQAQGSTLNRVGSPPGQAPNFSTRFASAYYGHNSPVEKSTSPSSQIPNPFTEHHQYRPRSGTDQSIPATMVHSATPISAPPPVDLPALPPPPPQQQQSRFGPSRPVSRSAATATTSPHSPPSEFRPSHIPTTSNSSSTHSRPTTSRSPFSTPITSPPRHRPYQILLINPNSTRSMTDACLTAVRPSLPTSIELTGYTAPYPSPTAIESITDAILSTEAVLRDLAKYAAGNGETVQNFDGMIVACFSRHPLVEALRESYDVPVVGIMEAGVYTARMLGGRFGIVASSARSKVLQEDAVEHFGLGRYFVGSEAVHLGVLELGSSGGRGEAEKRMAHASRLLVAKGADTILLGCAGMTELVRAAKDGVRDEDGRRMVNVIDPVEAGVQIMCSLVALGVPTSKKGVYKGEREGRRVRGQNWL